MSPLLVALAPYEVKGAELGQSYFILEYGSDEECGWS